MRTKLKVHSVALLMAITGVAGCSPESNIFSGLPTVGGEERVGVNKGLPQPSYRNDVNTIKDPQAFLESITEKKTPTLNEAISLKATNKPQVSKEASEEDKLRLPAIRDTASSYGAQAGLAYNSRAINNRLKANANNLDKIYDFKKLMVRAPDGLMVLPPVISEAKHAYELTDMGKSLRVADQVYEIVEQAKFSPVAPMWHTYLIRTYEAPPEPAELILPRNELERSIWREGVTVGWEAGVRQSQEIFDADLSRLERDYNGMIRYKKLLAEGKVSAPVLTKGDLGITGTGSDMRVNDRELRIMKDSELQLNSNGWQATIRP